MGIYQTAKKEILVCGQRFIVQQSDTMTGSKRYMLMADAAESIKNEEESDDIDAKVKVYVTTMVYPSCIAVTTSLDAPLPTLEEFMSMPFDAQELWLETVKELNPTFFSEGSEEEQEEKKS